MKLLITGGAGYIGYELSRSSVLNEYFTEIRIYDNLSRSGLSFFTGKIKNPKLKFIKADVLDAYSLKSALKSVDVVVHLAAFVNQPYNHLQNLQYEQVNRWGSLNLTRLIREEPAVKKVIYLSSAAVYGFRDKILPQDEPSPGNAYGQSKLEGEKYFELLRDYRDLKIVRAANVFGFNPCMRMDSVLNSWVFKAITERAIKIYGNGDQRRAFIPISELRDRLVLHIVEEKSGGPELCIGFCASLNEIKEWLLEISPSTEYTYLNRNQSFLSQNFEGFELNAKALEQLNEHFHKMSDNLII